MKVCYQQNVSLFKSWSSDDSSTLAVSALSGEVVLQHSSSEFAKKEVTVVTLSTNEALGVAERISHVLKGGKPDNAEGTVTAPQLVVTYTNAGEPFREGVNLSLSTGNWASDFSFSMTQVTAQELAKALAALPKC